MWHVTNYDGRDGIVFKVGGHTCFIAGMDSHAFLAQLVDGLGEVVNRA